MFDKDRYNDIWTRIYDSFFKVRFQCAALRDDDPATPEAISAYNALDKAFEELYECLDITIITKERPRLGEEPLIERFVQFPFDTPRSIWEFRFRDRLLDCVTGDWFKENLYRMCEEKDASIFETLRF